MMHEERMITVPPKKHIPKKCPFTTTPPPLLFYCSGVPGVNIHYVQFELFFYRTLKAVFQLHVFHTYVHIKLQIHFNITFVMNNCLQRENSAFPLT